MQMRDGDEDKILRFNFGLVAEEVVEFGNTVAENPGQRHAGHLFGWRSLRGVHVAVSIQPDAADLLFLFLEMSGNSADRTRCDRMVPTQYERQPTFLDGLLDSCAQVLASVRDFLNVLGTLFANGHLFRLFHGNIANVFHLQAKLLDARLQAGHSKGGGTHVHTAAAGAEVHGYADDANLLRHEKAP